MNDRQFTIMMIVIDGLIILGVLTIFLYPRAHTHEDELTIERHYITPGIYHIQTDKLTLNVTIYYQDTLLTGHTYRIKWIDGIRYDKIKRFEEIEK